MKPAFSRPRVAILGCGHVGRALAAGLLGTGGAPLRGKLQVWSRSARSVAALLRLLRKRGSKGERLRVHPSARAALAEADVVLLCVADDAFAPLVRELARERDALRGRVFHGQVVLFTSGYLPLRCLAPLRRHGCSVGRLHPLAPVPSGAELTALAGAPFALEGDARAVRAASALVGRMGGKALLLKKGRGSAPAYHAGASLLSGGLVALFHLAEQVMSDAVRSPSALREALDAFAGNTLRNIARLGTEGALTGALARGSEAVVRGHLAALGRVPRARELYRLLGGTMLELARARGSIDEEETRRLAALLSTVPGPTRIRRRRPRRPPRPAQRAVERTR